MRPAIGVPTSAPFFIADKTEAGAVSPDDKAAFEKCAGHCDKILDTMENMHRNASMIRTATKREYVVGRWEKHKEIVAGLEKQMESCPGMVKDVCKICEAGNKKQPMASGMAH